MWQLSLLNYIARISPYICLLFQDQMINDLHEMLFYSTHAMLSDAITFTSYDMTPSILSYIHYYMNICMPCFSFRTKRSVMMGLLLCICFFTGINMLHEWNDYMNEMTWLSLSSMYMLLFQEPTSHMNDMPFPYDMTIPLSSIHMFFKVV